MAALAESYSKQGQTIFFTNGYFDLLHIGHISCVPKAAHLGDVLVVVINSDQSVRRLKGEGRPVIGQVDRAALVAGLECVSHVLVFEEDSPPGAGKCTPRRAGQGRRLRPEQVVGREVAEGYGGRVCVTSGRAGLSTIAAMQAVLRGTYLGAEAPRGLAGRG